MKKMSKVKVGDRVRYSGDFSPQLKGQVGTVTRVDSEDDAAQVKWDSGALPNGVFTSNISLLGPDLKVGDRVSVDSPVLPRYHGRKGTVVADADGIGWKVTLDDEAGVRRFFTGSSLKKEPNMSIASRITTALAGFFTVAKPTTVDAAARELLAATNLASIGESKKKRAKEALKLLNIILDEYRPGTVRAYDSPFFTIDAVTKEPSQRLDEEKMRKQLAIAGLSRGKIDGVFVASRVDNKAATSIVVTEK
jgi:hypothetical protein